jgi:hypothetical protein
MTRRYEAERVRRDWVEEVIRRNAPEPPEPPPARVAVNKDSLRSPALGKAQ